MSDLKSKLENSDEQQEERLLKQSITHILDQELQGKISAGIAARNNRNTLRRRLKPMILVAASLAILVLSYTILSDSATPEDLALKFLSEQPVIHPGVEKGASQDRSTTRLNAINAYMQGNFQQAVDHYESLTIRSEEDSYYFVMAALYVEDYQKAIQTIEQIIDSPNLKMREEWNWYHAIALILQNDTEEALVSLRKIKSSEWNYDQAQQLLSKLE